jgi:hypothetical protein
MTVLTETTLNKRLTQDELSVELSQFIGTEQWYRHAINRNLIYTDGVKFFAENGGNHGAYWFLDKVACEITPLLKRRKEAFACITLQVNNQEEAIIIVTDGNETSLATYDIHYTDMQEGDWKFYLVDDGTHITLLLPHEY